MTSSQLMSSVSVVVTVYNYARYLSEALESVFAQTAPPAEVIVVDDGSTDDTADVAATYGTRIVYVYQPNAGPGAARNRGVGLARGRYLAFMDGDDLWEPPKLERQLLALSANPNVEAAFTYIRQFLSPDAAGADASERLRVPEAPAPGICATTLLVRRAAFDRVGLFPHDLAVGEFIDWYARSQEMGLKFEVLPDALAQRRIHGRNHTLRTKHLRPDYVRLVKAALDRRRAAQAGGEHQP